MSTNGIYMTILSVTIDKQNISGFQIGGLGLGVVSAVVMGVGDLVVAKLKKMIGGN
jgi:hypothetical protein